MTRTSTRSHVERFARIGERLGFSATMEASPAAPDGYAPRTDLVLAGRQLSGKARQAIESLARRAGIASPLVGGAPPVLGVEVEGTDPSSKQLEADMVNLWICGYPLAAVVTDSKEKNSRRSGEAPKNLGDIHRRAQRVARTIELFAGARPVAVIDGSDLRRLESEDIGSPAFGASCTLAARGNKGGTTEAAGRVLEALVSRGRDLRFRVGTDVAPPAVEVQRSARADALKSDEVRGDGACAALLGLAEAGPDGTEVVSAAARGKAFTKQAIDVVWGVDASKGLAALHELLCRADPAFRLRWPRPPLGPHVPLVAFEVDSKVGKHTAGSLIHLSRIGAVGALVVPDDRFDEARRLLETYRRALPLGRVGVWKFSEWT